MPKSKKSKAPKRPTKELVTKKMALAKKEEISLGVVNGDINSDLYSNIPCTVGYSYIRLEVQGTIKPCCIMPDPIGDIKDKNYHEVWHSDAYTAFRQKMLRIPQERFHKFDSSWSFCQQCSHRPINTDNDLYIKGQEPKEKKK